MEEGEAAGGGRRKRHRVTACGQLEQRGRACKQTQPWGSSRLPGTVLPVSMEPTPTERLPHWAGEYVHNTHTFSAKMWKRPGCVSMHRVPNGSLAFLFHFSDCWSFAAVLLSDHDGPHTHSGG